MKPALNTYIVKVMFEQKNTAKNVRIDTFICPFRICFLWGGLYFRERCLKTRLVFSVTDRGIVYGIWIIDPRPALLLCMPFFVCAVVERL